MNKQEQENTYNGWANYPTWVAKLWMDNEEWSYNHLKELVQTARNKAKKDPGSVWTKEEATLYYLEDLIKEFVKSWCDTKTADLPTDLLGWAIEQINFREIAENLLDD